MCEHEPRPGSNFRLIRCRHGAYHLTYRNTTLHISADDLRFLIRLMQGAARHLAGERPHGGQRPPRPDTFDPRFGGFPMGPN
jgi:hypothetical protein